MKLEFFIQRPQPYISMFRLKAESHNQHYKWHIRSFRQDLVYNCKMAALMMIHDDRKLIN